MDAYSGVLYSLTEAYASKELGMRYMVIAIVMALIHYGCVAEAKSKAKYTLVDTGQEIGAVEAIVATAKGSRVVKCEEVELKVSKSGTSLSLHKLKSK